MDTPKTSKAIHFWKIYGIIMDGGVKSWNVFLSFKPPRPSILEADQVELGCYFIRWAISIKCSFASRVIVRLYSVWDGFLLTFQRL